MKIRYKVKKNNVKISSLKGGETFLFPSDNGQIYIKVGIKVGGNLPFSNDLEESENFAVNLENGNIIRFIDPDSVVKKVESELIYKNYI